MTASDRKHIAVRKNQSTFNPRQFSIHLPFHLSTVPQCPHGCRHPSSLGSISTHGRTSRTGQTMEAWRVEKAFFLGKHGVLTYGVYLGFKDKAHDFNIQLPKFKGTVPNSLAIVLFTCTSILLVLLLVLLWLLCLFVLKKSSPNHISTPPTLHKIALTQWSISVFATEAAACK